MNITILTLGSRGDVQPYVALGAGLRRAGHEVTLAAGQGFHSLIEPHDLRYLPFSMDVQELLDSGGGKAALQGKNITGMMKRVRPIFERILEEAWQASQGADAIVYHPKPLAGYHIAERLGVPGFLALPLPLYSPTSEFAAPVLPWYSLGPWMNRLSFRLLVGGLILPYRGMINEWRKKTLGLPPAGDQSKLHGRPVTKLYAYSRHVAPVPADWDESSIVTGYWFLDTHAGWQPPRELLAFLEGGPPPVYVGFGSMAFEDASRVTRIVLEALQAAGQRGVLATGWGGLARQDQAAGSPADGKDSSSVYMIESAPHEWLFPRMSAVVHHGGAGTVGAGLRAGRPTVVCPVIADQPFWGRRVAETGAGPDPIPQQKLTVENLAAAIRQAVNDAAIRQRAETVGRLIREEDGVARAVEVITETVESYARRPVAAGQHA